MNILIAGQGQLMEFAVRKYLKMEIPVTLICSDLTQAQSIADRYEISVICGDAYDCEIMAIAKPAEHSVLIALTENLADNLVICRLAKEKFKIGKTITFVDYLSDIPVFQRLGVDQPICRNDVLTDSMNV